MGRRVFVDEPYPKRDFRSRTAREIRRTPCFHANSSGRRLSVYFLASYNPNTTRNSYNNIVYFYVRRTLSVPVDWLMNMFSKPELS